MKLSELLPEGADHSGIEIARVTAKPAGIDRQTLFFLLPGVRKDSRCYLPYCLSRRPAALVAEEGCTIPKSDVPVFTIREVRRRFAEAMAKFYCPDLSKMRFHGVTGTNGKTTLSTMLAYLLETAGRKVGRIGTGEILCLGEQLTDRYYSMTTPDPDLLYPALQKMAEAGVTDVIMEVSSHALALGKVAPIRFDTGVFTGLSPEHLDFHKTIENYYAAKKSFFGQVKNALICSDDEYGKRLIGELKAEKNSCKVLRYGAIEEAEIRLCETPREADPCDRNTFCVKADRESAETACVMPGAYNRMNAIGAIGAAVLAGIPIGVAAKALKSFPGVPGRYEIYRADVTAVIDYAHTPIAMKNILKSLKQDQIIGQKLTVVFGCGGERDKEKRPLCAAVAAEFADRILVTSDNPRGESPIGIIRDILSGFPEGTSYRVLPNRKAAIEAAILSAAPGDTVAILGKGAERYTIAAGVVTDFDERKIVSDALKARTSGNTESTEVTADGR